MIGVLLINLGTPSEPSAHAVRRYLREFLMDPRVLDINPVSRWFLVNLIIAPFRSPKSAKAYRKIWTDRGSPLLFNTEDLGTEVAKQLGDNFQVQIAMRYGHPSIGEAMESLMRRKAKSIRVLPLFPQYASSSTGSAQAEVLRLARKIPGCPPVHFLLPFFEHPGYIQSFIEIGKPQLENFRPDHTLFSFHGLPEHHILKGDIGGAYCFKVPNCCEEIVPANGLCYRAHCFRSARLMAEHLGMAREDYTICFQSRLGRVPWIQPYTDRVLDDLLRSGKKRIAVFCPAFVADCLETLEEIGIRAQEQAQAQGGEVRLIPSLNSHPTWVQAVCDMVLGY